MNRKAPKRRSSMRGKVRVLGKMNRKAPKCNKNVLLDEGQSQIFDNMKRKAPKRTKNALLD